MSVEQLCVNAIRILSIEAIQKANSGHPGLPMGMAPAAYTLWSKIMKHNPRQPEWLDRDRFVLSAGHGSMLLYSLLHLFGYDLSMDDLKQFRQLDSRTPGHPEYGHTPGVETTTGPLGQGFATAVGMALAEDYLASVFNKAEFPLFDHFTWVISGDGCMMEGITSEAASLAGALGLGKLIVLYDSNQITIEGSTSITFTEDVRKRFEACGWQTLEVADGNDLAAIEAAVLEAKKNLRQPSLIKINTIIGYGCPGKQGSAEVHGAPLGAAGVEETRAFLQWPEPEPFTVPQAVYAHTRQLNDARRVPFDTWNEMHQAYTRDYPEEAQKLQSWLSGALDEKTVFDETFWNQTDRKASRETSSTVLNLLASRVPQLIGGSADLAPSTKAVMKGRGCYLPSGEKGPNLHFGVREHAMAAMANGLALHGGLIPYVSGFFVFSDYMKPSMRLAALMGLPVIYVFTHDSIGVGEDGPTHQPIEQLAMLRSIPNMTVIRPADAREVAAAWRAALTHRSGPTALVLTRQNLPLYEDSGKAALKGAYVLRPEKGASPDLILIATGSEVELAVQAAALLEAQGRAVRVVSMPSWELFEAQSAAYKESVLPKGVRKRISIEAGTTLGWHKYVGCEGEVMGIDRFGKSAPYEQVYADFGLTAAAIVARAEKLMAEKIDDGEN